MDTKTQAISLSKIAILIVSIVFFSFRFSYIKNNEVNGYNATTWDAFGYYMYLPSVFIYHDVKDLDWVAEIDSTYHVTGSWFYQAVQLEEGTYTNKYLGGVAVLQAPFFLMGHLYASFSDYPPDGFSKPYQYAIIFGAILWVIFGFVILRRFLLAYFNEHVVALTILFIGLTSNLIQYVSIDGAMSHAWIFPLYAILLLHTHKWHKSPNFKSAIIIGASVGLATISRPTELIMIFIPILWDVQSKEKWNLVLKNKYQLIACIVAGVIAMSPQFIYWQHTTGKLIYDVGSKWYFLNPWWRVLFGPEKGWFLYTPVAILMVAGLFCMKNQVFKRSIITFCILNIWIIIAWSDWRYGASYSTRALTQSYPIFAVALASIISWLWNKKTTIKYAIFSLLVILTILNFYQLTIYNKGILESFSPFLIMK